MLFRSRGSLPNSEVLTRANGMLRDTERLFTSSEGLPRRPWYRHLLYAPGYYTGYGVKTLPGVREAVEQKSWADADREVLRLAHAIENGAAHIGAIAAVLEGR